MPSNYILGFASTEWSAAEGRWYDSHIGGSPVWPEGLRVQIPPCPLCLNRRALVLQAYAPHAAHPQRELYMFSCTSHACSSQSAAWLALRLCQLNHPSLNETEVRPSRDAQSSSPAPIRWDTDSEQSASDTDDDLTERLNLLSVATKTSVLTVAHKRVQPRSPSQKQCSHTSNFHHPKKQPCSPNPHTLPAFHVHVEHEPRAARSARDDEAVNRLLAKYRKEDESRAHNGVAEQWDPEHEEEHRPQAIALENFNNIIARAPHQILRYALAGEPIWPRHPPPNVEQSSCDCGAPFVFELQLLASCLNYLTPRVATKAEAAQMGMNFASIATYTCAKDCTLSTAVAQNPSFAIYRQQLCVQQDDW